MRGRIFVVGLTVCALAIAIARGADAQTLDPVQPDPCADRAPMSSPLGLACDAFVAGGAPLAATADDDQRPRMPTRHTPFTIGGRLGFVVEGDTMTAGQTFGALFGSRELLGLGALGDVILKSRVLIRASVVRESKNGTRGFEDGGQFFSTGVPLHLALVPIEIGAGLRFPSRTHRRAWTPYLGAALVLMHFHETSPADEASDDLPVWFHGAAFFGGVDLSIGRRLSLGLDGDFRILPYAIGGSDVSQAFGESNLGSLAARVSFAFRLGRP